MRILTLTAIAVLTIPLFFLVTSLLAVANRSGAQAGHTGAPQVNGQNCTRCHSGTVNAGPNAVVISGPAATFAPGSVIPVTVSLTGALQNPRNGYQMAAYATGNNNALAGWTSPNLAAIRIIQNHIGHTTGGTQQASWTQYFTTPTTNTSFTLYAAGNDTNGNSRSSGDLIYTTSLAVTAGAVPLSLRTVPSIGTTATLDLHSAADANKAYVLAASFSNAGIPAGNNRRIPLFPDSLFALTVSNLAPAIFQKYTGILSASGRATSTLRIFNNAALMGITLHHAFIVIDPAQPNGIGTISNPLPITII